MKQKTLILNFCALSMTVVSLYLVYHYYDLQFPSSFKSQTLCHISQTWNCDTAAYSKLGSFFSVPTGFFGVFIGLLFLIAPFFSSLKLHNTVRCVSLLNALACFGFLFYSWFFLKSFCPGCVIYYGFSWIFLLVNFQKDIKKWIPNIKILILLGGILFAFWNGFYWTNRSRMNVLETSITEIIDGIKTTKNYDDFPWKSPFFLTDKNMEKKPLRLVLFSDFECSACELFASQMLPKIKARYGDQISILYSFYPLDAQCNSSVTSDFHQFACRAARYSYCGGKENFLQIHDLIYENQTRLNSDDFFSSLEERYPKIKSCLEDPQSLSELKSMIADGHSVEVSSTPTIFINGYKLEGLFPLSMMFLIFDHFLKEDSL